MRTLEMQISGYIVATFASSINHAVAPYYPTLAVSRVFKGRSVFSMAVKGVYHAVLNYRIHKDEIKLLDGIYGATARADEYSLEEFSTVVITGVRQALRDKHRADLNASIARSHTDPKMIADLKVMVRQVQTLDNKLRAAFDAKPAQEVVDYFNSLQVKPVVKEEVCELDERELFQFM